jgi:transcriptional regulator with XRE-family HTH domain
MADIKILFGQKLRIIREKKQLSQEQLSSLAGLNRTYISKIERGKRNITIEVAEKLAEALCVELKELFDFRNTRSSHNINKR